MYTFNKKQKIKIKIDVKQYQYISRNSQNTIFLKFNIIQNTSLFIYLLHLHIVKI